ncbi:polyisoprenoid diphosphate/phosphate phosphohydrolase PLPP6-like isoform X2 [Ptiloglossa arizonensis]|uniref:polyisoprenoid diphosphate/phosphate phosphohydrolase PLPP6-like isoform X2 n=1 Tax=Ptiloglossa arizonensis TaxID=3350558 RepID=UPI003F9FEC50
MHSKRKMSPIIKNILIFDIKLTENVVRFAEKFMPMKQLKMHYKELEISCRGILWISSLLACIWILNSKRLYQIQVNLLIGLLLDILVIALLKAVARRRRPSSQPDPFVIGSDKYSFPSGHASRAILIVYFFKYLWPVSEIYLVPLFAWVAAIALSGLLKRRHYILDVIAGLLVGYTEGLLMNFLYLKPETCLSFVSWITNKQVEKA